MKILALDASSTSTGWAYYDNDKLKRYNVIDFKQIKDAPSRLRMMVEKIYKLIDCFSPTIIVIESPVVLRNAHTQKILALVFGSVFGKCVCDNIDFLDFDPSQWRRHVDRGKKPRKREELKEWSKNKVREMYNIDDINDDVSDAILIGQAYINYIRDNGGG